MDWEISDLGGGGGRSGSSRSRSRSRSSISTRSRSRSRSRNGSKKNHPIYQTLNNGGTIAFYVEITKTGKTVKISKSKQFARALEFHPTKVFIGEDKELIGRNSIKSRKDIGNTILLKTDNTYVFIGDHVYQFKAIDGDTIVKYYSPVGNNAVPYPYAIGKKYIYLLGEKIAVEKSYFDFDEYADDIYGQYYYPLMVENKRFEGARQKKQELDSKTHKLKTKILRKKSL